MKVKCLTSETVKGSALSLKSIDNIKSSDSLSSSVLSVGHGISDDVLKENLKDTTGLLVDKTRDTLDATSSCQSSDRRLGNPSASNQETSNVRYVQWELLGLS